MHVVVVGGGIVGVSCAHSLARRGADVTVVEKAHLGAGNIGKGGGIRTQFSTPANVDLSLASLEVWDDFEERFGVDVRERRIGYLLLARETATANQLRADVSMQTDRGAATRFVDPLTAADCSPGLYADRFVGGAHSPDDRFVDPNRAFDGYVDAADKAGVEFVEGVAVTDVVRAGSGTSAPVTGVVTQADRLSADYVVNAAGAWAGRVSALADVSLPVEPVLRRLLVVDPDGAPEAPPLTMDLDTGSVFYPLEDGRMVVSGQHGALHRVDPDGYTDHLDEKWVDAVLDGVADLAAYFDPEMAVEDTITGLYAMTPDQNPVIEESVPGLLTVGGFSGHGFMHAPASGRIAADLVFDGETSLVDLSPFASERFDGRPAAEQSFI